MRVFRWVWWRWARWALTMRVFYNQRWVPQRFGAMCFGRYVVTSRAWLPAWVLDHEYRHVQQYARHGFVWYLVQWFWGLWQVGYWNIPFERDAQDYSKRKQAHRDRREHERWAAMWDAMPAYTPGLAWLDDGTEWGEDGTWEPVPVQPDLFDAY